MKKVGILTINDDNNYGNRLQNYALQEFLKSFGYNVETINNQKNIIGVNYIKKRIKNIIKNILKLKKYERYNNFMFFNKIINYSKYVIDENHIPHSLNSKYDYFIVGSDQVWNPNFYRMSDIDFLTFADSEKRIAYSASFGIAQLPGDMKEYYKTRLNGIKHISVREEKGKEIVNELTNRNDVRILVDPTMLLTKEEWIKVEKKPKYHFNNEKYILNYFLGEIPEERKNKINQIAKKNGCKVINLLDENDPFYSSGPAEFLYLERNAFLICTDSFHSSIFAILFNRPFFVFERIDKTENMNSRLDTLLKKFELEDRKIKDNDEILNYNCDFSKVDFILEKERKKSMEYIESAINNKKEIKSDN